MQDLPVLAQPHIVMRFRGVCGSSSMTTRASEVTETRSVPLFVFEQPSEVVETAPSTVSNFTDIAGCERPHGERSGCKGGYRSCA